MFFSRSLITCLVLLCSLAAQAYLPSTKFILTRTAKNNGRGAYIIDQDVAFSSLPNTPVVRESWTVVNGQSMRLHVGRSPLNQEASIGDLRMEVVYYDNRRVSVDPASGKIVNSLVNRDFIEAFSHSRSYQGFADALIRATILDADHFRPKPPQKGQQFQYSPEQNLSLTRSDGIIAWVLGRLTPAGKTETASAALWIEQDVFRVRKLRLPSTAGEPAEIDYDKISPFPGGLMLARERKVRWGTNTALIKISKVRHTSEKLAIKQIDPKSLKPGDAMFPTDPVINEFYSRFR